MAANPSSSEPFSTLRFVSRTAELEAVREALIAKNSTHILYFHATAGVGKTRLLKESEFIVHEKFNDSCQFGGFFDFYETELHSNSLLEQRFLKYLDPNEKHFGAYRTARREFERQRRSVPEYKQMEEMRHALGDSFVDGVNELSADRRLLFCFDTIETIQYESDDLQPYIGPAIEREVIETLSWFTTYLPRLKNVVVLLAGRTKPILAQRLQQSFSTLRYDDFELKNFSAADVKDYFAAITETYEQKRMPIIAKQMREMDVQRAYDITQGRPLLLSFATDLLRSDARLLPEIFKSKKVISEQDRKQVRDDLLNALMNAENLSDGNAIQYLALARKGLDYNLFERLMNRMEGWDSQRCASAWDKIGQFSYCKTVRDRDNKILKMFLHDELYDVLGERLIQANFNDLFKEPCEVIIQYYDERIAKCDREIAKLNQALQTLRANQPDKEQNSLQTHQSQLQAERVNLIAERLYYQLESNPVNGYEEFSRLSDQAIINHQVGLDMLLRDEMLRYFDIDHPENNWRLNRAVNLSERQLNPARIKRGSAIRWVQRSIARGHFEDAINMARTFRAANEELKKKLDLEDDPLFNPILQTYEAEAGANAGLVLTDQEKLLTEAIKELVKAKTTTEFYTLRKNRHLGRAYNDRGYVHTAEHRYRQAIDDFLEALRYFRKTGLSYHIVGTRNNLGYVYGVEGDLLLAEQLSLEAKRLCEKDPQSLGYLKGLVFNTLALNNLEADRPHRAYAWSKQAIEVFESLQEGGEQRGVGLANLVLGEAARKRAKLGLYSEEQTLKLFNESQEALNIGLNTFKSGGPWQDNTRVLEAQIELGCLYRDWADFIRKQGKDRAEVELMETQALEHFSAGLPLAVGEIIGAKADLLNDWAELYFNQGNFDEALKQVNQADEEIAKIDVNYSITRGRAQPVDPVSSLYVLLGKNSMLRARIALQRMNLENFDKEMDNIARDYVSASAYFDRFGGDPSARANSIRRIYSIYSDLLQKGLTPEQLRSFKRKSEDAEEQLLSRRQGFRRSTTLSESFNDVLGVFDPIA